MKCKNARDRILDLALDERVDDALLRAHLESCSSCQEALASRRTLVAAIDHLLKAEASQTPSPILAARVRERIDEEEARDSGVRDGIRKFMAWWGAFLPDPLLSARPSWKPVAAAVFLLSLVTILLQVRPPSSPERSFPAEPKAQDRSPSSLIPQDQPPSGQMSLPGAALDSPTTEERRHDSSHLSRASISVRTAVGRAASRGFAFPEVIVPPGELTAALRWSAASAQRPATLPSPQSENQTGSEPLPPLNIEEIRIAPLQLAPLGASAEQPSPGVTL